MTSTITITCTECQHELVYDQPLDACPECGNTVLYDARYDTGGLPDWKHRIAHRHNSIWRYHELLPLRDPANRISMGEGGTPLVKPRNISSMLGLRNLYVKDERQGPTGSFKDRQASVAISVMKENGIKEAVVASTGNVAIAYSAYAAQAGIKLWAFLTSMVPSEKMREVAVYGTEVVKITGTYDQTKQIAAGFAERNNLFYDKGLRSLAAKESMKTVAFEIAEQLGMTAIEERGGWEQGDEVSWEVPDWYIQAVSGGLGPIGVMKGFQELMDNGLTDRMPKVGVVQSAGCAPMVNAWKDNSEEARPVTRPETLIATLATGDPGAAYGILRELALTHGGTMEAVTDEEAFKALRMMAQYDGLSMEPAAAVAFAGLFNMVRQGMISPDEVVVVNLTGHTFPVEKQILGDEWERSLSVHDSARTVLPEEGLLAALSKVDKGVSRIAIIEDNIDAARLVERILRAHGNYEVLHARDGREGLELVRTHRPDLIILDLMMPEVDGFGVLDSLKADHDLQDVPVIVVTAQDLTPQERERLSSQVQSLLHKGSFMDADALQEIVNQLS